MSDHPNLLIADYACLSRMTGLNLDQLDEGLYWMFTNYLPFSHRWPDQVH